MKLSLITTTINVPRVLELYRRLDPDVEIIVAGDRKTPPEARELVERLEPAVYLGVDEQQELGYRCSDVIGWDSIQRRNIALLEAIRRGADIVITIDDDNVPLDRHYFDHFRRVLGEPFHGALASTERGWFNIGAFLEPSVYHRGFPYAHRHVDLGLDITATTDARVGVAAGLWLGDPDIDAMERITNRPLVHRISGLAEAGLVVKPGCFSPFNTQNTAVVRELAPLIMVIAGVGRFDDIWASYIAQRVMVETGHHVHYGPPLVWQERNPQDLLRNLKDEMLGMEVGTKLVDDLCALRLQGDVPSMLRQIYEGLAEVSYLPPKVCELGLAWLDDVQRVLA